MNSIRRYLRQLVRWPLAMIAGGVCLTSFGQVPEPAGWYTGDIHVHRSCGGSPVSLTSIRNQMANQNLSIVSLLADIGNGEVQNPATDIPKINGQNDPISTASRIVHWDAEWHWDATYTQYPHQALGGHIVALGLTSGAQVWQEYTYPIFQWIHQRNGIGGFAHMQYLDDGIPQTLNCCIPIEYPVEVALGSCDFISEDVGGSDTAMRAYYRLLNCGFRPGFAAGSDYPCNANIGQCLTYVQVSGALTYAKWVDGIRTGRTVVSRNGHDEFLDLKVNGTLGPGDQLSLPASGTVNVTVQWSAIANLSGTIELVQNGVVVASRSTSVSSGSPQSLTATVNITKSSWLAARRMSSEHELHTGAMYVLVNNAPIRASAADAQFYVSWMDTLLQRTSPGGIWASFFINNRAEAQARYQAARNVYAQIAAEAGAQLPLTISTTSLPGGWQNIAYSASVNGSGGLSPYTWSISNGSLPPGLTLNTGNGTISGTPTTLGTFNFTVRLTDSSNPTKTTTQPLSIAVTTAPTTITLWPSSTVPSVVDAGPDSSVELGVKFRSDVSGTVLGIRYYKAAGNNGTHVGNLWSSSGTLLGTATFSGETSSGWQQVLFSSPVSVSSNTTYVASYHANNGHYSENQNYFSSARDNPPLHAPTSSSSGGNGVYGYGTGNTFPNQTWMAANYWVDVVFQPGSQGPPPPDTTPPTITSVTPASGATGVSTNTTVTAVFNEAMNASTINVNTIVLRNSANVVVSAGVTYNSSTRTAVLTPQNSLAAQSTYTATVVGGASGVKDVATNALASNSTWSFTTGGNVPDTTPPAVTSVVPANGASGVSAQTTVRATFNETMQSSTINAANFFLQTSGGTPQPANVSYDSGTRTATLTPTSSLSLLTTYVATLKGGAGGIADAAGNPLSTDVTWSFTTLAPDTTAPTVTSVIPAAGATGVSNNTAIVAVFSEAMNGSTLNSNTFAVLDSSANPITGTVAYNPATLAATFTPSATLLPLTTYTAAVEGGPSGAKDAAGNPLANDFIWFFTTMDRTYSIWNNSVPAVLADSDSSAVELGLKFRSSVAGSVLGVRFYKGSGNTGTHVGSLWTSTGTRLAQVTFVNESASGWQYQAFATPVPINSNTTYVVSYQAPVGRYSVNEGYFTSSGFDNLSLHALSNAEGSGNGVYRYGASAFPNQTWNSSHYWVDLLFQPK